MDPVTGLAALAGISLASLVGLRLNKTTNTNTQEGFNVVPDMKNKYPSSVETSQTRYNDLTGMVNPLIDGVIPVGSDNATAREVRETARGAFGGMEARHGKNKTQTLDLGALTNKNVPRHDTNESVFGAIQFCKQAGASDHPFKQVSRDGNWKFSEVCGVCVTQGVDEEGSNFVGQRGLLLDPNTRQEADKEREAKGYPYSRVIPSLATCQGAPNQPVFASNQKDLERFKKRQYCIHNQVIGGPNQCGLCYENDTFAYVDRNAETNQISLVLRGTGDCVVSVNDQQVAKFELQDDTSRTVKLRAAKEGDSFRVVVKNPWWAFQYPSFSTTCLGYLIANNANGGTFTMPLNLIAVIDDATGSTPTKSGQFITFSDVGVDVATMRAARGKTFMSLRGTIPFTFVNPDDFSAMDCPAAPYQTKEASVNAFATDQPCYAKGSKPGRYNDECLKERILSVGCTNAGTLYAKPSSLNTVNGQVQSIGAIYQALLKVKELDMVDPAATKQCSGREILTPCDPFVMDPTLQFRNVVFNTDPRMKLERTQARQCLSYLYANKGSTEKRNPPRVGPTYLGPTSYSSDEKADKNIYCLPDGELNPDKSEDAVKTLVTIADSGFGRQLGVDAIKSYLNAQLKLAIDSTRNANTDPERKAAIRNCFGKSLNALAPADTGGNAAPSVVDETCGIVARFVRIDASDQHPGQNCIQIAQLVVIDKNGVNVALNKPTNGSSSNYSPQANAGNAVDGTMSPRPYPNVYHSGTGPNSTGNPGNCGDSLFWIVDLQRDYDIKKVIFYNRSDCCSERARGMKLKLLDANQNIIVQKVFPNGDLVIPFDFTNPSAPSSCVKPKAVTCGVSGQYIRIQASDQWPGQNCLQIAQLVVKDKDGVNVALNKPTSGSPPWIPASNTAKAVDGTVSTRSFSDIYHASGGGQYVCSSSDYWMVNLQQEYDITSITYYNRADCCSYRAKGMKLQVLDANMVVVLEKIFTTGDMVIPFDLTNPNAGTSCTKVPTYSDLGCWNDQGWQGPSFRALTGPPQQYGYTVDSCFQYALAKGADTFALQNGGWCVINTPGDNPKKYGAASGSCATLGSAWVNHLFQINGKNAVVNNDEKPIFYDNYNYTGNAVTLDVGSYPFTKFTQFIRNDTVSSIKVPSGYKVVVYRDDIGSQNITLTSDTPDLRKFPGFDKMASALVITKV